MSFLLPTVFLETLTKLCQKYLCTRLKNILYLSTLNKKSLKKTLKRKILFRGIQVLTRGYMNIFNMLYSLYSTIDDRNIYYTNSPLLYMKMLFNIC